MTVRMLAQAGANQSEDIADHARPLTEVLLHKLGANHVDEGGGGVVCHGLGQHSLAAARGSEHQHSARRINANLPRHVSHRVGSRVMSRHLCVQLRVCQRELNGLAHLLLLDVHATNVGVLRCEHMSVDTASNRT